jgi:hypothetical protein
MRFLDDCSQDRIFDSAPASNEDGHDVAGHGRWARAIARLLHLVELETDAPIPVRVFYKFDSGRWRHRSTRQLHKVYRCK